MNAFFKTILILTGAVLLINAGILFVIANYNFGTVLLLAAGAVLFIYGLFFKQINMFTADGILKWIRYASVFLFVCLFALAGFLAAYGKRDSVDYSEDALIVLGAGVRGERPTMPLVRRLDKAVEYYKKNKDAVIVVSGGKGFQEDITEALAMERYLVSRGVDLKNIIKEEKAASTYENFRFSKEILDSRFKSKSYKTAFITNDFHIYRSVLTAKDAGFEDVTHLCGKTEWYTLAVNYLRECCAVLKVWILGN